MGTAVLKKAWKNLPKGTVLESLSEGIEEELVKGKFIDDPKKEARTKAKPKAKRLAKPIADKQMTGSRKK